MNRSQKIIRTSIIGIIANVLLATFKAAVGILANLAPKCYIIEKVSDTSYTSYT